MVSEHKEHCIQSIVVADRGSMVQRRDNLFIVLVSRAMSMVSTQGSQNVECLDSQGMRSTQVLAVFDKEFAIDLNHLVPVKVSFVELDKYSAGPGQALIVNMAGVAARAINANIYLFRLMEAIGAIIANSKAYCNVDGLGPKIFRQSNGPSPGYDGFPDKQ